MSNCSYCLTCVIKCVSMFLSCLTKINDYIHNRDTDNQKFNQFDDLEISQKSKKKGLYSSRVTKEKPCVKRHSKTEASGVNVGAGVGVGADVGDDINKIAEKFVNDIVTKVIDDNDSNNIRNRNHNPNTYILLPACIRPCKYGSELMVLSTQHDKKIATGFFFTKTSVCTELY